MGKLTNRKKASLPQAKTSSSSKVTPTGSHLSLGKGVTPFKVSKHPQSTQRSGGPGLKGETPAVLAQHGQDQAISGGHG